MLKKYQTIFPFLIIVGLATALIYLISTLTVQISIFFVLQEIESDIIFFQNLDEADFELANNMVKAIKVASPSFSTPEILKIFGVTLALSIFLYSYRNWKEHEKVFVEFMNRVIINHKLGIPIFSIMIAIFFGISLSFFSSMNFLLISKDQTIFHIVYTSINNANQEELLFLLMNYLNANLIEYLNAVQGFIHFAITSCFPVIMLFFIISKIKTTFWHMLMFVGSLLSIPLWLYWHLTLSASENCVKKLDEMAAGEIDLMLILELIKTFFIC